MAALDYVPTLPAMLRRAADRFEERRFMVRDDRQLSFRELERESAHIARGLLRSGVGKASRVGIMLPDSPDWALVFFAAARIGAFVVPLSTLYQTGELKRVLRQADVDTLCIADRFRNHDYLARLEEAFPSLESQKCGRLVLPEAPYLRAIRVWGECDRSWASGGANELKRSADESSDIDEGFLREVELEVTPADLALMIFTSGTSAEPKGVMHTHGTAVRHSYLVSVESGFHDIDAGDRLWSSMPLFWIGGLNPSFLGSLHCGSTHYPATSSDPLEIMDFCRAEGITHMWAWPTQIAAIGKHPAYPGHDFSSMKRGPGPRIDASGAAIPPGRFAVPFGMTESFGPHSGEARGSVLAPRHAGSSGRALQGMEHKVVDAETGRELSSGEEGELCLRGNSLMMGLYKKEREEVFDADGFYHTGDSCVLDDDRYLYFKGRRGEMVKTRGANVAPKEVEAVIEAFEDVQEVAVLGLPDETMEEKLVAVVVPALDVKLTEAELRERLKTELSSYKVPREFFFYRYEDVPRTDSNKPHKRKLRNELLGGPRKPAA